MTKLCCFNAAEPQSIPTSAFKSSDRSAGDPEPLPRSIPLVKYDVQYKSWESIFDYSSHQDPARVDDFGAPRQDEDDVSSQDVKESKTRRLVVNVKEEDRSTRSRFAWVRIGGEGEEKWILEGGGGTKGRGGGVGRTVIIERINQSDSLGRGGLPASLHLSLRFN